MGYFLRQYGKWGIVSVVVIAIAGWAVVHVTSAPCKEVSLYWGMINYTKPGTGCQGTSDETRTSKPVPSSGSTSVPSSMPPIEVRHGIALLGVDAVLRQLRADRRLGELVTMESGRRVYQMAQQTFFFVDVAAACRIATSEDLQFSFSQAQALRFREPKSAVEVHYQNGATGYLLEVFGSEESSSRIAQLDGGRTAEIAVSALPFLNNSSLLSLPVKRIVGCASRYVQNSPKQQVLIHDLLVR